MESFASTQGLGVHGVVDGHAIAAGRASIMGALSLYLNFINLFLFMLRFMGGRRN